MRWYLVLVLTMFVTMLTTLGIPDAFRLWKNSNKEPIAIIEDFDKKQKVALGANDIIGDNIQILGVENGRIRLLVKEVNIK